MKTLLLSCFGLLFGNSIWLLMSETLMLGYAQTAGIFALGVFTVIWTNRIKKKVADLDSKANELRTQNVELDTKAIQLDTKIDNYHKEVDGKVSALLISKENESLAKQELAKLTGEQKGAEDNQAKTDAAAATAEPIKVIVVNKER